VLAPQTPAHQLCGRPCWLTEVSTGTQVHLWFTVWHSQWHCKYAKLLLIPMPQKHFSGGKFTLKPWPPCQVLTGHTRTAAHYARVHAGRKQPTESTGSPHLLVTCTTLWRLQLTKPTLRCKPRDTEKQHLERSAIQQEYATLSLPLSHTDCCMGSGQIGTGWRRAVQQSGSTPALQFLASWPGI